jgi:acyl carrier protein
LHRLLAKGFKTKRLTSLFDQSEREKIIIKGEIFMIKETIRQFLEEKILFSSNGFPYSDTTSFLDTGIIDSMNIMELVMFIEEQFNITVDDSEVRPENLDSVELLADYIQRKLPVKS